mgnify:FL=1
MRKNAYKELDLKLTDEFVNRAVISIVSFLALSVCRTIAGRIVAVIMILCKIPVTEISAHTGLSMSVIYNYGNRIRNLSSPEEVSSLLVIKSGSGRKNKLSSVEDPVIEAIDTHNFFTLKQIAEWVHKNLGVSACIKGLSAMIKRHNVRKLKAGSLPAKADVEKQRAFYDDKLKPLMDQAREGKLVLLFVDAAHFVMGCDHLGAIYGRPRRFARTFSGRSRYNVLGALDYCSQKVLTVTNDKYIKAASVCELIKKTRGFYGRDRKIVFVLDNAKYQTCALVRETADEYDILLEFLPPYSPNLNLIERLWKFAKKHLREKVWDDFALFCQEIDKIIDSTAKDNHEEIEALIGDKVQFFDNFVRINDNTVALP